MGGLLYNEGGLSGFGQHSFIFDTFALYSIIGGVLCVVAVYYLFVRNYKENHEMPLKIAMITCVTLLYVFNNATESVTLALTIFYPFFRYSYIEFQKVSCVDSSNCARCFFAEANWRMLQNELNGKNCKTALGATPSNPCKIGHFIALKGNVINYPILAFFSKSCLQYSPFYFCNKQCKIEVST